MPAIPISRRHFLLAGASGLASLPATAAGEPGSNEKPPEKKKLTTFQVACMTLPYSRFPLDRALKGIKGAGYRFIAWGTSHQEDGGKRVPVMAADAPPAKAKELAQKCRDLGLEPLMMFSGIYPEAKNG